MFHYHRRVRRIDNIGASMSYNNAVFGLASLMAIFGLAGCSGQAPHSASEFASSETRPMDELAPTAEGGARRVDTLAYEHVLSIEMSRELLPTRLREIEAACNADSASNCTVLDVALTSNRDLPSGNIRMRLAPGGVEPLITLASK